MLRTLALMIIITVPTFAHAGECGFRKDAKSALAAIQSDYQQTPQIPALDKAMKQCTVLGLQAQQQAIYSSPCTQSASDDAFNKGVEATKACTTQVMAKFSPPVVIAPPAVDTGTNPAPASIGSSGSVGLPTTTDDDKTKPVIKVPVDMSAFGAKTSPSYSEK